MSKNNKSELMPVVIVVFGFILSFTCLIVALVVIR